MASRSLCLLVVMKEHAGEKEVTKWSLRHHWTWYDRLAVPECRPPLPFEVIAVRVKNQSAIICEPIFGWTLRCFLDSFVRVHADTALSRVLYIYIRSRNQEVLVL